MLLIGLAFPSELKGFLVKSVWTISLIFTGICIGAFKQYPREVVRQVQAETAAYLIQLKLYHFPHQAIFTSPICCVWLGNSIIVSGGH